MIKSNLINYKPMKNGFPYKMLMYLYKHGKSDGCDIQEAVGLNAFAKRKGVIFFDKANKNFDSNALALEKRGLLKRLPDDQYKLTKLGYEFMKTLKIR